MIKIYKIFILLCLLVSNGFSENEKAIISFESTCFNLSKNVFDFQGTDYFKLSMIITFENDSFFNNSIFDYDKPLVSNDFSTKIYNKDSNKEYFLNTKLTKANNSLHKTFYFKELGEVKEFFETGENSQMYLKYEGAEKKDTTYYYYLNELDFKSNQLTTKKVPYTKKEWVKGTYELVYDLSFKTDLKQELIDCEKRYEEDKAKHHEENIKNIMIGFAIIVGTLLSLYVLFHLLKNLYRKTKEYKNKIKDSIEKNKINKITEEESIRQAVKRTFDNSSNKDIEELQELINQAVTEGDSKTAQVLLKLLKKKKEEKSDE